MKPISWEKFPLPLIQVNPPELLATNELIVSAYENGVLSNRGELQQRASDLMAKHVGIIFDGLLTSSNTSGLVAALLAVDVRNRHVVISNFTFAATMHSVILAGGIPILCDISDATLEIDISNLKQILSDDKYDVAAVMPTRVFGFINDLTPIIEECEKLEIPVIVDAAAAYPPFENSYNFKKKALCEIFSLHSTKVFGIGEGGLVIANSDFIQKVISASNFGFMNGFYETFEDGLNAKADEFASARAIVRFNNYTKDVLARQEFVKIYKYCFSSHPNLQLIKDDENTVYTYFPLIFETEDFLLNFKTSIDPFVISRRYYYPTMKSGYIGNARIVKDQNLDKSESLARRILCLPVYSHYENNILEKFSSLIFSALDNL